MTRLEFVEYGNEGTHNYHPVWDVVDWPEPTGVKVNMMPFKWADHNTIPHFLHQYLPLIDGLVTNQNYSHPADEVWYLTVEESFVPAGVTQRRPGLHTESFSIYAKTDPVTGLSFGGQPSSFGGNSHIQAWGGHCGIIMGSNVERTTRIWDKTVAGCTIKGFHPDVEENIRRRPSKFMKKNRLYWLSDIVPHECTPKAHDVYRQYFRVVLGNVDVWFSENNTWNPSCEPPDSTYIVYASKFDPIDWDKLSRNLKRHKEAYASRI